MRTTIISVIGLLTTLFYACNSTQQSNSYSVEGMLKDSSFSDKTIYIVRYDDEKQLDTTVVDGQKFVFKGKVDTASLCYVHIAHGEAATFILEKGNIKLDMLNENDIPSGTPMNDEIAQIAAKEAALEEERSQILKMIFEKHKGGGSERADALFEAENRLLKKLTDESVKLFKAHANDAVGEYLLYSSFTFGDEQELEKSLKGLGEWLKSRNKVKQMLSLFESRRNSAEGKPFVDFKGTDLEGNPITLSDFVGKGNYVLMDMWASWCGPCRGETPNLRQLHEQFKDKGLVVLGLYVWDDAKNLSAVIEKDQITWPQIIDSEGTATKLYGVDAIPHIILFSPDGTILHRNLRGNHMINTVTELMNKE